MCVKAWYNNVGPKELVCKKVILLKVTQYFPVQLTSFCSVFPPLDRDLTVM